MKTSLLVVLAFFSFLSSSISQSLIEKEGDIINNIFEYDTLCPCILWETESQFKKTYEEEVVKCVTSKTYYGGELMTFRYVNCFDHMIGNECSDSIFFNGIGVSFNDLFDGGYDDYGSVSMHQFIHWNEEVLVFTFSTIGAPIDMSRPFEHNFIIIFYKGKFHGFHEMSNLVFSFEETFVIENDRMKFIYTSCNEKNDSLDYVSTLISGDGSAKILGVFEGEGDFILEAEENSFKAFLENHFRR